MAALSCLSSSYSCTWASCWEWPGQTCPSPRLSSWCHRTRWERIKCTSLSGSHLQIGVGGYSFAVNNNGHLLYHPDLRPMVMIIVVVLWVAWFLYWVGWHGYAFQLFNFCICSSLVRSSSPTTTAWTWWRWSWWTITPSRSRAKIALIFSW